MRKEDKLRPYRVDYFEIDEMRENDQALVRSEIVRAVTAFEAANNVLGVTRDVSGLMTLPLPGRVIVRAARYYRNLVHKKDVYKAVEDLFSANKAVKVMEQVEAFRQRA